MLVAPVVAVVVVLPLVAGEADVRDGGPATATATAAGCGFTTGTSDPRLAMTNLR